MKKIMLVLTVWTCMMNSACTTEHFNTPKIGTLPNDVIIDWDEIAYQAFGGVAYQHSLMASRVNAMTHLAMHDALNAIFPVYEKYAFTGYNSSANPIAAAASAAHTVLVAEIPDKKEFLDNALNQSLAAVPDSERKEMGIQLGKEAGQAILDSRANDGAAENPISPVAPSEIGGVYQAVPPFDFIFAPFWQDIKPFGLNKKDQFRSDPFPSLDSEDYVEAFNEVKEIGRKNSNTRTEEQTEYAYFWYEFSEAGWNRVTREVAFDKKLDLLKTARLFALVDMAMADAYIAGWDSKFYYNLWRPYTAIQKADIDGNEQTEPDVLWESEMPTPPVQDYPSTHSALGNAAASVLAGILGDNTSFSMSSPTALPGAGERSFTGFKAAAIENADSRVTAGIHFRFACDAGLELGEEIGKWMVNNHLKPLK
ncbi:vanadium-dependent haloperoxidase [Lunatibacter salilacus]|uniref:vanadium-dependent haloperoxidase n=1 Tax=Lunatibacter salilacus TaxID=2483804 RepID=UPI00131E2842|nr:vanadium-dependent haloperoxidase [Lunatibacter salilacus]